MVNINIEELKSIFSKVEEICLITRGYDVVFSNTEDKNCINSILQGIKDKKSIISIIEGSSIFSLKLNCIRIDSFNVVVAKKDRLSFTEDLKKKILNKYLNIEVAFKSFSKIVLEIISDFVFEFGFNVAQVLIQRENRIIDNVLIDEKPQSLSIIDYTEFNNFIKNYISREKKVSLIDINNIGFLGYNINKEFFNSRSLVFNKCFYLSISISPSTIMYVFIYDNISDDYKRLEDAKKIEDFLGIYEIYSIYLKNVYAVYKAENIKVNFITLLNHELRTPLNSVLGYSQLLSSYSKDPEIIEGLNEIQIAGKDILMKIERMILLQELKFDLYVVKVQPTGLKTIVDKVMESLINIRLKKIDIEKNVNDLIVKTDPNLLYHVLLSFIDNAVKFTLAGKIMIESVKYNGFDGIRIRDNGPGFDVSLDKNYFREFSQIDFNIMTRSVGGLGIGLSIAYEVSKVTNIGFDIKSVINEGTEVVVYIK